MTRRTLQVLNPVELEFLNEGDYYSYLLDNEARAQPTAGAAAGGDAAANEAGVQPPETIAAAGGCTRVSGRKRKGSKRAREAAASDDVAPEDTLVCPCYFDLACSTCIPCQSCVRGGGAQGA